MTEKSTISPRYDTKTTEKERKELRTQWGTPRWLFNRLNEQFMFTVDVCAVSWNAKLPYFVDPQSNGLDPVHWSERIWCNPPYSDPAPWLRIGLEMVLSGKCPLAVYLLPAATDTRWFSCAAHGDIELFRGRIKHEVPPGLKESTPPGAQMLVIFDPETISERPKAELSVVRRCAKMGFYLEDEPQLELI